MQPIFFAPQGKIAHRAREPPHKGKLPLAGSDGYLPQGLSSSKTSVPPKGGLPLRQVVVGSVSGTVSATVSGTVVGTVSATVSATVVGTVSATVALSITVCPSRVGCAPKTNQVQFLTYKLEITISSNLKK